MDLHLILLIQFVRLFRKLRANNFNFQLSRSRVIQLGLRCTFLRFGVLRVRFRRNSKQAARSGIGHGGIVFQHTWKASRWCTFLGFDFISVRRGRCLWTPGRRFSGAAVFRITWARWSTRRRNLVRCANIWRWRWVVGWSGDRRRWWHRRKKIKVYKSIWLWRIELCGNAWYLQKMRNQLIPWLRPSNPIALMWRQYPKLGWEIKNVRTKMRNPLKP